MSRALSFDAYRDAATGSGLFSADFYLSSLLATGSVCPADGETLFEHYTGTGWKLGLSPSARFDVEAYLRRHPRLRERGVDPLRHYIEHAAADADAPGIAGEEAVRAIAFYAPDDEPGGGRNEWASGIGGRDAPRGPEAIAEQARLAREFGLFGFCFHLGWADGDPVLPRPVDLYLQNPDIDLPFCFCLANGNGRERTDEGPGAMSVGRNADARAEYAGIHSLLPAIADPRYIRVNGRPLLLVDRADLLSNPNQTFDLWRQVALLSGLGELYIAGLRLRTMTARDWGLDALVDFPPHHFKAPNLDALIAHPASAEGAPLLPGVMPGWDDTQSRGEGGSIFTGGSAQLFEYWLFDAFRRASRLPAGEPRLVFVNAWNDFAACPTLDPKQADRRSYLEALKRVSVEHSDPDHPLLALRAFLDRVRQTKRPAVLFVSQGGEPDDPQRLLLRLIDALLGRGDFDCFALLKRDGKIRAEFEVRGATFVLEELERPGWAYPEAVRFVVNRIAAQGRIRAALCNTASTGDLAEALAAAGLNVLGYLHELPSIVALRGAEDGVAALGRVSRRIIATSQTTRRRLTAHYGIPPGDIEAVTTGLRSVHGRLLDRRELFRRFRLPESGHVVVGSGAVGPGLDAFMQVARRLQTELRDAVFVWVGGDGESEAARLAALTEAEMLGISARTRFLGQTGETTSFIKEADVLVLTSREDPHPLAVLDALEAGTPVVCFDEAGGAAELIGRGAGAVVAYLDVAAMAASARAFLTDAGRRAAARAAAAALRGEFRWDSYVDRLVQRLLSLTIDPQAVRQGRARRVQKVAEDLCVIIPSYNHAQYIEAAVDSVLAQSLRPAEIRIIDDGSRDGSPEILRAIASDRLGIHVTARGNLGAHATINEALSATSRPIVAILNSDDLYHPLRFEELLPRFDERDAADLLFTRVRFIDSEGRPTRSTWYEEGIALLAQDLPLWLALFRRNVFMTTSNLVARRDALLSIGGFRPFRYSHDVDLMLRALFAGKKVRQADATLCDYRVHGANTISESGDGLALEEAYFLAEFIRSGQVEPSRTQLPFLYETLREKRALRFFRAFMGWRYLPERPFDYRTSYDYPDFAALIAAARVRPEPSREEFMDALDTAGSGWGRRAYG